MGAILPFASHQELHLIAMAFWGSDLQLHQSIPLRLWDASDNHRLIYIQVPQVRNKHDLSFFFTEFTEFL